jgi:hypothetical protein
VQKERSLVERIALQDINFNYFTGSTSLRFKNSSPHTKELPYQSTKMVKNKRSREEVETYDSDGGFVSNDDGNAPKPKKSKKAGASKGSSGGDDEFWAVSIS